MTHFADLSYCRYFATDPNDPRLMAIGWLERGFKYTEGSVSPDFLQKLRDLLTDAWQAIPWAGGHECDLCELPRKRRKVLRPTGYHNFFVPGDEVIYASPELVEHYITAHEYYPPLVFQEAVLRCPQMNSRTYFRAMKAAWPNFWPLRLATEDELVADAQSGQ